ncbi:MAG: hypothetical protein GX339_02075 [Tissierellia bacterium]|nr:hypothetical protein [Tissierellia bacterium]
MILLSNIIKGEYVVYKEEPYYKVKSVEEEEVTSTPKEDLFEIYNQREIILKEAEEEAMKIINSAKRRAQAEVEQFKKRGYEEGYNSGLEIGKSKGYKEGYQKGQTEISELLENQNKEKVRELAAMIETIENEKLEIISNYENELIELSVEIAEKIIKNEVDTKDHIVSSIISNAIKDYRNVEWIKIYLSTSDIATIEGDKDLANELKKISKDVKIEALEQLEKGSAIIETEDGIVNTSIDTRLKNLKEMVLNKNAG